MTTRWHLLFPLCSSLLYVLGAVLLKRATMGGVGVWRAAIAGNLVGALFFMPLWLLGGPGQPVERWWQPAVVALLILIGQCLTLVSLMRGDVSVATPVLGAKVVLVAFFTTAIGGQAVPSKLWVAAALSTLAIGLLNWSGGGRHHDLALTVGSAFLAATAFALFDVLVMSWAPAWGAGRFLPIMSGFTACYSVALLPLAREPMRLATPRVWQWLIAGSVMVALQGVVLVTTVAVFGDATAVNIVYSARGIWSVVLVWIAGTWMGAEALRSNRVLGGRLVGAALMSVAIISVFR
jgi:drug/metabolite transporter (DMT)-like permease